jgi:hypothetical protein
MTMTKTKMLGVPAAAAAVAAMALAAAPSGQAASYNTGGKLLAGARSTEYSTALKTLSPVNSTRQYYDQLPSTYHVKYPNQHVVISFLHSSLTNTQHYVRSIPAGAPVELVYHHEPEGTHNDYSGDAKTAGASFVSEFNAQANVIHANSSIPVAFIGGGYQYTGAGGGSRGIGGYFIPPTADDFYLDSYQQNSQIEPASQDPEISHFRAELAKKGKKFNGFCEYGRGIGSTSSAARAKVIGQDYTWLKSLGTAKVWIYFWNYSKTTGDNWKFTDSASINAWKKAAIAG